MATIESIIRRLDKIKEDGNYFRIEELVDAVRHPEGVDVGFEELRCKYPLKTFSPAMLEYFLHEQSPEDRSE